MSRRLVPTLADYVVVAINPALVMTLVGSLIYFLLETLYQGAYPDRLQFSLTMFVIAIVLVSRIAMENGFEHAAPFGIALAIVVGLAMQQFISYGHGPLAHFGWLVNWGLMAVSWWCAHQLTWDCTVIDESQETEGQGLLETVGIDRASGEVRAVEPVANSDAVAATETVAGNAPDDAQRATGTKGKRFRWEDILNRKDRPHAPGVWVVYFSLAALPIFGVGQAFIPAANAASRRYVFVLFVVYVASGLGLLLTTSFLALRRYLRQRKLEMPTRMVATWLTTGVMMIAALLAIVALLPRPNAEFAVSKIPWAESASGDQQSQSDAANEAEAPKSSPHSVGREGTRDSQASTGGGVDHSRDQHPGDSAADRNSQGGKGTQPGGQAEAAGEQENRTQSNGESSSPHDNQTSSGGERSGAQSSAQGQRSGNGGGESSSEKGGGSAGQKSNGSGQQKSQSKQDSSSAQNAHDKTANDKTASGKTANDKADSKPPAGASPDPQPSQSQPSAQSQQPTPNQRPGSSPPNAPTPPIAPAPSPISLGFIGDLLKWVFYGAVLAVGGYFAWIYREQVLAFLRHWLEQLRDFWDRLLGRSPKLVASSAAAPVAIAPPARSFHEFADPFAAGKARGWTNAALVKYTFSALEAWSRDRGYDRRSDETPHEFARQVGSRTPALAPDARALVDEYGRIVYGLGASRQFNVEQLRRLWQTLRSLPAEATAAEMVSDRR